VIPFLSVAHIDAVTMATVVIQRLARLVGWYDGSLRERVAKLTPLTVGLLSAAG